MRAKRVAAGAAWATFCLVTVPFLLIGLAAALLRVSFSVGMLVLTDVIDWLDTNKLGRRRR